MSIGHSPFAAFLPFAALLTANSADKPISVVELHDEIAAPAMRTRSLQLLSDGSIVMESHDFFHASPGGPYLRIVFCKLGAERADRIGATAEKLISALPAIIDADSPTAPETPLQSIRVEYSGQEKRTTLHKGSSRMTPSRRRFLRVWAELTELLTCTPIRIERHGHRS